MRPQLRRPPPGATDVLAALAPWFPQGFAPSREKFGSPAQPLDVAQLGPPLCQQRLKGGSGSVAIYRHRLATANQYVRVSDSRCDCHQPWLKTEQQRLSLCEQGLKGGSSSVAVYRHRLATAKQSVRVGRTYDKATVVSGLSRGC